ncbi:hypothetical protein C5B42_05755 [Candidatus Cerribacteria bacterium 'Amazon FNV 2010 28 9']|uniref:Uncharacterized protein n=1 Tax=Candidatus Cerribacteria bacterium 'Amazon FNV 2010 28 9' TaxID=2081795 RepID=A0A317JMW3_9BACT|nr:MAG: hypothetical protein C5B42_05755 [Candidatus Cerribacteria bacterium 'Amazon FNV 2010 28 9']
MQQFLMYVIAGFSGGVIRGLVGFAKHRSSKKKQKFKSSYFATSVLISGVIGSAAGALVGSAQWQISFLAGYAGIDFIENLYKMKIG